MAVSISEGTPSPRERLSSLIARFAETPPRFATPEEIAAEEARAFERDVARRTADAGIPERYRSARLSQCGDRASEYVDRCLSGDALNLVVAGPAGEGKTHTACAALSALVERRPALALFADEPSVMGELRDTWGSRERESEALCRYAAPYYLVLDDLGRTVPDRHTLDALWRLLNRRYSAKRPTIYTTQYDRESLAARLALAGGDAETAQAIVRRVLEDDGQGPRAVLMRAVRR